jgi:two-component system response regulator NreC
VGEIEGSMAGGDDRIAIVLAGDHAVARPELRSLLHDAPGLEVVSDADDAESALRAAARHERVVFVLDLDRPGDISSLDTIRTLTQGSPDTGVIVLVNEGDERFVRHALRAGAVACILKGAPDEELVDAVRRAAIHVLAPAPREPARPPDDLTQREFDVLRLLALGHTNAEIAAQLQLSVRTVEAHRAHLQRKLGRPSRAELVRYALEHGLLPTPEDRARGQP